MIAKLPNSVHSHSTISKTQKATNTQFRAFSFSKGAHNRVCTQPDYYPKENRFPISPLAFSAHPIDQVCKAIVTTDTLLTSATMFPKIFSTQGHLILLVSLTSVIFVCSQQCEPCSRNDAGEVEEPGHGGSAAFNCDIATIEAQSFDNGTAACRDHQLMMWQRDCCPDPPSDHCFMCDSYNGDKVVPRFEHQQFGSPDINFTCSNVAERITYLDRDGIFSEVTRNNHWLDSNSFTFAETMFAFLPVWKL